MRAATTRHGLWSLGTFASGLGAVVTLPAMIGLAAVSEVNQRLPQRGNRAVVTPS